jgi:ribosomal protein S18 acetylase RimI-like enzyme
MAMDRLELYARVRGCLGAELELFGSASANARIVRLPGVLASISPATPDRSLFNSAVYNSLRALEDNYDEIARQYLEAGVRAFTVWTDPADAEQAAALLARGHKLDAQPWAMAAELDAIRWPDGGGLDWFETREMALIAALNDAAYGFPSPAFDAVLDRLADSRWLGYVARLHGKAVSCLLAWDGDFGDLGICAVATLPEARGRGIATRLLAQALKAARARGLITTSLQASPQGYPIYL